MKKYIVILLALCLVLCGCDAMSSVPTEPNAPGQSGGEHITNPTQPGGETMEPTRPAEVELVDYDARALTVTISINPEFALGLTRSNEILSVEALNADAEKLLANLDLVGQFYDQGIKSILMEAEDQDFLNRNAKVTFSVQENAPGAVTMATLDILSIPVKDYREDLQVDLEYEYDTKNPVIDSGKLKAAYTESNTGPYLYDNYTVTVYRDNLGHQRMSDFIYEDGTRRVIYFDDNERIVTTWYADGSFGYEHYVGDDNTGYFLDTEGNRTTFVTVGNWSQTISYDGSITEMFYEGKQANRQVVRSVTTYLDGSTQECIYENGECVQVIIEDANSAVSGESGNTDGTTTGTNPDGNGISTGTNSDGSTYEITNYPNGNIKTSNTTWPNGDYINQTYYENGNIETNTEFREGRYSELSYDENGQVISLLQRDSDGTECDWDYEHGEAAGYTVTYPDGDYEQLSFYENGNLESHVMFLDGSYSELYYDENGQVISAFSRDSDGTEDSSVYENGNLKTRDITWLNGDYEYYTYYENGQTASIVALTNGEYWENHYDEDGNLTKAIRLDENGDKVEVPVS